MASAGTRQILCGFAHTSVGVRFDKARSGGDDQTGGSDLAHSPAHARDRRRAEELMSPHPIQRTGENADRSTDSRPQDEARARDRPRKSSDWTTRPLAYAPRRRRISSLIAGTISCMSPTTAYVARVIIGASGSVLIARIVFDAEQPAQCWIAPEMPHGM